MTPRARREMIEQAATKVFAERGYHAASVDEIAQHSGISVPVLYDHFQSKQQLHRCLLERHFAELRAIWHEHLAGDDPLDQRTARAIDAWLGYFESHPYASRMLFRDTTGHDEAERIRHEVAKESLDLLLPLFTHRRGVPADNNAANEDIQMALEIWRAGIQGLALWWQEHHEVPRHRVVTAAMNTLWFGLDQLRRGQSWPQSTT